MKKSIICYFLFIIFFLACDPEPPGVTEPWAPVSPSFHVTVTGNSSGDGSISSSWDLATALSGGNSNIKPGDTVYIHGGTYNGVFTSNLYGTQAAPIVVRPWHNDEVIIDGNIHSPSTTAVIVLNGTYTWLTGLTITNSAANHQYYNTSHNNDGVTFNGTGNKLLNCIIRGNTGNGIWFGNGATDGEISGCIVYNNGVIGTGRGHGHGIYAQNHSHHGLKIIRNNIFFNSFGKGIQIYGEQPELHHFLVEDNIFFNAAAAGGFGLEQNIYIGGHKKADNQTVRNNVFYSSPGHSGTPASVKFGDGDEVQNGQAVFTGNYCVDSFLHITKLWDRLTAHNNTYIARSSADRIIVGYDKYTFVTDRDYNNNTYYRGKVGENVAGVLFPYDLVDFQNYDGQEMNSVYHENLPTQNAVFVKPAGEDRWHAAVYNWENSQSVNAAVPGMRAGDDYELYFVPGLSSGPVASGRYNGTINIPLSLAGTPAPNIPIGMQEHAERFASTLPFFGAFLIVRIR